MARSRRLVVAALAVVLTLAGCGHGAGKGTDTTQDESVVGAPVTTDVSPTSALNLVVPGVGTITGRAGAVSGAGSVTARAVSVAFTAGAITVAGYGVDLSFSGTTLRTPLTVTFATTRPSSGLAPAIAHQTDEGTWQILAASTDAAGRIVFTTQAFSLNVPVWIDPVAWFRALTDQLPGYLAAANPAPACGSAPAWARVDRQGGDRVQVCLSMTSQSTVDLAEVAAQSARGVAQEIDLPTGAASVSVDGQTTGQQKYWSHLGLDPTRVIVLPAGARARWAFAQPEADATAAATVRVTYLSAAVTMIDAALGLAADVDGDAIAAAMPYLAAQCLHGVSAAELQREDLGGVDFADVFTCALGPAAQDLRDPAKADSVAKDLLGDPAANRDQLTARLRTVGEGAMQTGWLVTLWSTMQAGYGGFQDGVRQQITGGDTTTVTLALSKKDAPPAPKPTITDFGVAILGPGHVNVSYTVGWPAGEAPVTCHFIIDGVEAFAATCGSASSWEFHDLTGGDHSFSAVVVDKDGVASDPAPVLVKSIPGVPAPAPSPAPKPTATNLVVVTYGGGKVGVAFDVGWATGHDPVTCHYLIDGVEKFAGTCTAHASHQFTGITAGSHTFAATVTDSVGLTSDPTPTITKQVT